MYCGTVDIVVLSVTATAISDTWVWDKIMSRKWLGD